MLNLSNQYVVILDACVLAPMPLCDTLLRLAEEPAFFLPRWSEGILNEVARTLQKFGYSPIKAERRLTAMRAAFEDAMVAGYECLTANMTNHDGDRHVLAAAVRCGAHAIVSDNKKHFNASALRPYDLECLSSDEFLVHQFHLSSELVLDKLQAQATRRRVPIPALLEKLAKSAPTFAGLALTEFENEGG